MKACSERKTRYTGVRLQLHRPEAHMCSSWSRYPLRQLQYCVDNVKRLRMFSNCRPCGCRCIIIRLVLNDCRYPQFGCAVLLGSITEVVGCIHPSWLCQFGSRTVQKPDPLSLGGPNPDLYPSTLGFRRVWLDPSVPISGSAFRVPYLWSHSDMLLLIVKYWHWYVMVHFRRISRLDVQNKHTHAPNHILKTSVNRASTERQWYMVLQSVLPIKAANNSIMTEYDISEVWFPRTHDQKLLTLRWHSFSWWGREGIAICFAYKGGQKYLYDWLQPIGGVISKDACPKIVDAPLTLIFMMGQGGYCNLFYLQRRPKIPLWLTTTYGRCDFPGRMTKNRWRSVDAHFHDGARRVLQSVLPITAANNSFITDYNLSEAWFPRTHDQKSLTLRWRSFSWWGREGIAICFAYKGCK